MYLGRLMRFATSGACLTVLLAIGCGWRSELASWTTGAKSGGFPAVGGASTGGASTGGAQPMGGIATSTGFPTIGGSVAVGGSQGTGSGTIPADEQVVQLALGANYSCALLSHGAVQCWNMDPFVKIDGLTFTAYDLPTGVGELTDVEAISGSRTQICVGHSDGRVSCLEHNCAINSEFCALEKPFQAIVGPDLPPATNVAAGARHACAITRDGALLCWGNNSSGELGDGTTTATISPVVVVGISAVTAVTAGGAFSCALLRNGTVYCWGNDIFGQLGDGKTENRASPQRVVGVTGAVQVRANYSHTCALIADGGRVMCWGRPLEGQLGDPRDRSSFGPTLVEGLTGVQQLAPGGFHTCALLNSGEVACWGYNVYGQLGDGTQEWRPAPVRVVGVSDAVEVEAGEYHTCARLRDGTVTCWGLGANGQSGTIDACNSAVPVPVQGLP